MLMMLVKTLGGPRPHRGVYSALRTIVSFPVIFLSYFLSRPVPCSGPLELVGPGSLNRPNSPSQVSTLLSKMCIKQKLTKWEAPFLRKPT